MTVVTAQMNGLLPSKSAARTGPAHPATMSAATASRPTVVVLQLGNAMLSSWISPRGGGRY